MDLEFLVEFEKINDFKGDEKEIHKNQCSRLKSVFISFEYVIGSKFGFFSFLGGCRYRIDTLWNLSMHVNAMVEQNVNKKVNFRKMLTKL